MIPESRRAGWVNEDFVDSDSDIDVSPYLRSAWNKKRKNRQFEHKEFSRLKTKGLTKLQAYVASHNK